jgi:hypothetical protein
MRKVQKPVVAMAILRESTGMSARRTDLGHACIAAHIVERPALPRLLEGFGESSLLERVICPVARFDVIVDHEPAIADRAVPDFMIALAVPHKGATAVS